MTETGGQETTMDDTREVETAVLSYLENHGVCTMEQLFRMRSNLTLNQVFFAVDRLSRQGKVILRHPAGFDYLVSSISSDAGNHVQAPSDRRH